MVARGIGHHARTALLGGQPGKGMEGATELERPHALKVLALEEQLRAQALFQGGRAQHRRAVRVA